MRDFSDLIGFCREMGAADVAAALSELALPRSASDNADWRAFADNLWRILEGERGFLPPRRLTENEYEQVNEYFYANELLVRCLELAYVSDRPRVLDGLLRPPVAPASPSR